MILLPFLGLIFGSFISALSYRNPLGISNLVGRSFCDKCKYELKWYDNIPLLSFLILRGKCRSCNKKISLRYPLIEIISAVSFYLIGFNLINLILFIILFSILIIDFEHQIIPDTFIFVGLFVSLIANRYPLFPSLLSGFLSALFLLSIHLITKGKGMGLGDVKFAVLGGILVGLKLMPVWLLTAFLTGGLIGAILILGKVAKLKDKIAFGPFLIIAIPVSIIWGEKIIKVLGLL